MARCKIGDKGDWKWAIERLKEGFVVDDYGINSHWCPLRLENGRPQYWSANSWQWYDHQRFRTADDLHASADRAMSWPEARLPWVIIQDPSGERDYSKLPRRRSIRQGTLVEE